MTKFDDVKQAVSLKEYAESVLQRAPRGGLVCPKCGSGTGQNKTSAFSIKGDGWKCFSCEAGGDIFDLAGIVGETEDKAEQLRLVAEWGRIDLGDGDRGGFKARGTDWKKVEAPKEEPAPDYSEGRERHRRYMAECARRMAEEPNAEIDAYLEARGITHAEAVELGIGYDLHPAHDWKDGAGKWHKSPRLILPWLGCDYYHIDRAIDARAHDMKYDKPPSTPNPEKNITQEMCVGAQPIYNPAAFEQGYIIVVEGVLDAIAVQLCGYNAVALGGTAVNPFVTEAAARKYGGVVIDMLDADGKSDTTDKKERKGRGAGADLIALLEEAGIRTLARAEYEVGENDDYNGHKDAGEWLASNRAELAATLEVMRDTALEKAEAAKDAEYRAALRHFSVKDPANVAGDVLELRGIYDPIPTGLKAFDSAMGGGLSLGETTFLGAVSSYGKTSLSVQIADSMAAAGYPVLFVTIEQSARELVSKSLSRLVFVENLIGWNIATPSEIMSLDARRAWSDGQNETLAKAVGDYSRRIAPKMRIIEGGDRPTVNDIKAVASLMAEHDGRAPVVFIDYLQLLAPLNDRYDDKKNADVNVSELRKMARDLNTHVWCISSLNRASYSGIISLDSFKESGGIEYGADNLLGLQPSKMAEQLDGVKETNMKREADKLLRENKRKADRDCELVVLKRRNGALPDEPIQLTFKTQAALFLEPSKAARQARARAVL